MQHLMRMLVYTCNPAVDAQAKTPRIGQQDGSEKAEEGIQCDGEEASCGWSQGVRLEMQIESHGILVEHVYHAHRAILDQSAGAFFWR